MDHRKLDADLTVALGKAGDDQMAIFVELQGAASGSDRERLSRLGLTVPPAGSGPFTATVDAGQVASLSEDPQVRYIRLSRPLRLLDDR